jgi:hypothetical protein
VNARFGAAVAVVAVLALAGCDGGGSGLSSASAPPSPSDIAAKAGCTGWTADTGQLEMYVKESGTCTVNSQPLSVDTFNTVAARDGYVKVAATFGGTYGEGPLWVIHGDDAGAVGTASAAAGGTLVP